MLQEPDSALVEAAMRGDAESFTELCRRYWPALVAIAHSILGDRHLAEDAAQEALASAARKLPQLRRRRRFGAWLAAICRNAAYDLAKDKGRTDNCVDITAAASQSDADDTAEAVKDAIAGLNGSEREIIFLRFYDSMSYERISAVLGISEQAINGRLRRAKRKIAEYLNRNGFGQVQL